MANGAPRPEIFVSYSHRDEEAKDFVNRHLKVLQTAGNVDVWDDRRIVVGDDWFQIIETKLNASAVAVLLISTDFLGSEFCIKEEVSRLLERRKRDGMMIAPILLRPCAWKIFPWLKALQMQPRNGKPLLELDQLQQEHELTEVVLAIHGFLEKQAKLIATAVEEAEATGRRTEIRDDNTIVQIDGDSVSVNIIAGPKPDTTYPALPEGAIDLTRLPTSGFDVVGRDDELRMLDEAFDGTTLNVVSLRAWGGVGKSTLVNKWCEYLAADNFRGAQHVFAWSFYSQGTNKRVTSADAFVDAALRFFGDDDPEVGSPWAKGERLAELVGKEKALLILDGMEPLQDEHQGIKDPALSRLVECLAADNAGLCVITTREPVKELSDFPETTVEKNLEQLSKQAGRALLKIKGLRAADDVLERVSEAFGNHALALNLLASFLRLVRCPIQAALNIPDLPDVSVDAGKHPRRVMDAFAKNFGEGPELDLLHVMGLFDRPADGGCIAALKEPPAIPGLTDHLVQENGGGLATWWRRAFSGSAEPSSDAIWEKLLAHLRDLGLLAEVSHHAPDELDAHPLVREHFGARLQTKRDDAWKAGHERMYEHLKTVPEKPQPDTLAAMAPLFQAVHHGCKAGRRQEALDEVYHDRIVRQGTFFLTRKLGAFGADLGLVASFFDPPFEYPASDLTKPARAWLLNQAAFRLRALGRLSEAEAPIRAAIENHIEQQNLKEALRSASNLLELQLALGDVTAATTTGEEAIDRADRSDHAFERMNACAHLGSARHQAGAFETAIALFEKAETMQAKSQPGYPRLYSVRGYQYCNLLLTLGQAKAVWERAEENERMRHPADPLLDIALEQLSLGRAALALGDRDEVHTRLKQAIDGLRGAGTLDYLPHGLLARAAFFRDEKEYAPSQRDLDEVMRIATRSGMRLHECDAHLEYARLALAEGRRDDARPHLKSAAALVSACGYHRRDPEIAELKEKLEV